MYLNYFLYLYVYIDMCIGVSELLCCVADNNHDIINQIYIKTIYILFILFFIMDYYRMLNIAPCAKL